MFDAARGLFWNIDEKRIRDTLEDESGLTSYINKSPARKIMLDQALKVFRVNHFELIKSPSFDADPAYTPNMAQIP